MFLQFSGHVGAEKVRNAPGCEIVTPAFNQSLFHSWECEGQNPREMILDIPHRQEDGLFHSSGHLT